MTGDLSPPTRRIIIISGLSGSGKTVALQALEDIGYYCIDNLPLMLLAEFGAQLVQPNAKITRAAVSIDSRNLDLEQVQDNIHLLEDAGIEQQVVFLESERDVLIRRYSETRRKHPMSGPQTPLVAAIDAEIELMQPIRERAEPVISTSHLTPHELREKIRDIASSDAPAPLLLIESFGFKHGVPTDADYVFDVRCLPNPYWEKTLRPFSGLDTPIIEFLADNPSTQEMLDDIAIFVKKWFPKFAADHRSYLTVAIGCTGGRHRSVYIAEALSKRFHEAAMGVQVQHRDLVR